MTHLERTWLQLENKLKAFILSKVPDKTVADDILQDVFIKVHLKMDTLRDETKLSSFIFQITHNLIMDHFRKNNMESFVEEFKDVKGDHNEEGEVMEEALNDMIKMMDNMAPEHCEALCLTELDGLSIQEYAERTGLSYTAAKTRIHRAKNLLRERMMQCCHYEFDKYGTVLEISPHECCCCHPEE